MTTDTELKYQFFLRLNGIKGLELLILELIIDVHDLSLKQSYGGCESIPKLG